MKTACQDLARRSGRNREVFSSAVPNRNARPKRRHLAWVHEEIGDRTFRWQDGYAAFTVSATVRVVGRRYISNLEEHHRFKSFHDEFVEFLEKAGIQYDQRYLD